MSYFLHNTNSNNIDFLCVNLRVLWNSFAHIFSSALIGHRNCWYQGSKQDWFTWPGNIWSYYLSCSGGNANDYTDQKTFTRCCVSVLFLKEIGKVMLWIEATICCSWTCLIIVLIVYRPFDFIILFFGCNGFDLGCATLGFC